MSLRAKRVFREFGSISASVDSLMNRNRALMAGLRSVSALPCLLTGSCRVVPRACIEHADEPQADGDTDAERMAIAADDECMDGTGELADGEVEDSLPDAPA